MRSPTTIESAPFTRNFTPADLDLDDLAEAIRFLLEDSPPSDLLSPPERVSHVSEATTTL